MSSEVGLRNASADGFEYFGYPKLGDEQAEDEVFLMALTADESSRPGPPPLYRIPCARGRCLAGELRVSVADEGSGFQPLRDSPGLGLGLAIIAQLTDSLELLQGDGGGIRVVMRFAARCW